MPIRLAFLCVLLLLLITSAFAQNAMPTAHTLWDHNGSVVYLVANGSAREFYYEEPRLGMLEAGARPGSLLFRGQTANGQYFGTAFIFDRRCGQVPYQVSGPILDNYERVVLTGQAPRVASDCRIQGYSTDTLDFTLLKPTEVAEQGTPATLADPRIPDVGGVWQPLPNGSDDRPTTIRTTISAPDLSCTCGANGIQVNGTSDHAHWCGPAQCVFVL